MRVKYIGPIDSIDIPSLGIVALRGIAIDVADDSAEILLAQTDNWAQAQSTTEKKG